LLDFLTLESVGSKCCKEMNLINVPLFYNVFCCFCMAAIIDWFLVTVGDVWLKLSFTWMKL